MSRRKAMVRRGLGVCLCVCLLGAGSSTAEIYRWVDRDGKMHFTQDLAAIPPLYRAAAKNRAENPIKRFRSRPTTRRRPRRVAIGVLLGVRDGRKRVGYTRFASSGPDPACGSR